MKKLSYVTGLLLGIAVPASADTVVAIGGGPVAVRTGFVVGGSIDGGNMGCQNKNGDDCGNGAHPAGGFSAHAGGMIGPNLAIIAEIWGMAYTEDNVTASQVLATANLRGWIAPRLWLQGGVGLARSRLTFASGDTMATDVSNTVPAFDVGMGLEVLSSRTFGLDVELRGGSGLYEDNVRLYNAALGVGVSWF